MKFYFFIWIIFIFSFKCFKTQNIQSSIDQITQQLETAFRNIEIILRRDVLVSNFNNVSKNEVNDTVAKSILSRSKLSTEKLVNKTNNVIDKLQSNLTSTYKNFIFPNIQYLPLCKNHLYIPYYRAKTMLNRTYPNLSKCKNQSLPFKIDPFLDNFLTNREVSTAHVPTTVFDASLNIQQLANWTKNIDQIFKLNREDSQLKWQYFCSSLGWFKIYPGIMWNIQTVDSIIDDTLIDLFDCRSQQFYLQSTAYPKKMLIMLDRSGSMAGRSQINANFTVNEILNTLTENDFFNILMFYGDCSFADDINTVLIPATERNKMKLFNKMNIIYKPFGVANFMKCWNVAFNLLQSDKENQTSKVPYNYFISIVTDGSFTYSENKTINNIGARVFTYLTVQGAPERSTVKSIACSNNGFASEIPTLSVSKETVQLYLNVVARNNAIMRNAFNIWTGVQQMQMRPKSLNQSNILSYTFPLVSFNPSSVEITFSPNIPSPPSTPNIVLRQTSPISIVKEKQIKLFVSSAKALYDERAGITEGILLGSVGIDISTNDFIKTVPFWQIGINAYLFGITSRGFIVFHPKFRPQYKNLMKTLFKNVDITEVEFESNLIISNIPNNRIIPSPNTVQLRTKLLTQPSNNDVAEIVSLNTLEIVDDFRTGFKITRKYYAASIKNTPYKFGLSVPIDQRVPIYTDRNFSITNKMIFNTDFQMNYDTIINNCEGTFYSKNQGGITMMNYEFCQMTTDIATLNMKSALCTLLNVFINNTLLDQCVANNQDSLIYLNNIYTEMKNNANYSKFWAGQNGLGNGIQQIFSMHFFGTIRYYNYDDLSYQDFITNHNLGINDPLYKETILTAQYFLNNNILVARPLPNNVFRRNINRNSMIFTVTTPLHTNETYIGIVGVQVLFSRFQDILTNNVLCKDMLLVECFVITESGLILLNNQQIVQNGIPLKDVNCLLMESLLNNSIFFMSYFYDFQGLCAKHFTKSISSKLINPFSYLFRLIIFLVYELFIFVQKLSFTSFRWLITAQEDLQIPYLCKNNANLFCYICGSFMTRYQQNPSYNKVDSVYNSRPCSLKIPYTMIKTVSSQLNGSIVCPKCVLNWNLRPISNTNLFFIVLVKPNFNCSCNCSTSFGETIELLRNVSEPITNPFNVDPSYYSNFVSFTMKENSTSCISVKNTLGKMSLIALLTFSVFFINVVKENV